MLRLPLCHFACLLLLAMLAGCPAGPREGAGGRAAGVTGAAGGGTDAVQDSAPAAEKAVELPPSASYGEFSVDGLKLGANYDEWAARISPRQYEIYHEWAEEGLTGHAFTVRRDAQMLRDESAFFLAGRLVSLDIMQVEGQEAFDERVRELEAQYGPSTEEPPAWAKDSWFFSAYEGPVDWFDTRIWQDEPHRSVLIAGHNRGGEWSSYTLFDVDDHDAVLAALAAVAPGDGEPPAGEDGAAGTEGSAAGETQPVPPPEGAWQLDGFRLGLGVEEVRAGLPSGEGWAVQEQWRVESHTGMILVRTSHDEGGMQGSLMFYEGELVAVLKYVSEAYEIFRQRFEDLKIRLGEPSADTPAFAQGRAFVQAMLADERRPDEQYLWGESERQWLLIAGYDYEDKLASYMLIAADKYDQLAAEMEHMR